MLDFIIDSLKQGGIMLLPIFIASVIAWTMGMRIFLRLFSLSLWRFKCRKLIAHPEQIQPWMERKSEKSLQRTVAGFCLQKIHSCPDHASQESMENLMDEALKWKITELNKEISTIGTFAAMAPLLGLLGTVSGMIHTFDVISAFGTSNPSLMADSISEALVTTQDGLAVALPLMVVHTLLLNYRNRIEQLSHELGNAYIQHRIQNLSRAA